MSRYPAVPPHQSGRSTPLSVVSEVPSAASTPPKRATPAKAVPRLLSTRQAAEYLGVSANTIRKYRDEGKIRAYYVGEKLVKYSREDLVLQP